jgi:two-component system chemotaxis response regulator CheY
VPNILIIEDAPVNREFLRLALRPYGTCEATPTGEQGVERFRAALAEGAPFDIVFLDIMLPGIDGLKTLELLRAAEDSRDVPESSRAKVIVTTAVNDSNTATRAFIHGHAAAYITKPFVASGLIEELRTLGLVAED